MKYIRTKDMVLTSEDYDEYFNAIEIVKQADTIEELCDTFVRTRKDSLPLAINCYGRTEFLRNFLSKEDFIEDVFGAIWTDKGLIYVAKMNEKGEFELL